MNGEHIWGIAAGIGIFMVLVILTIKLIIDIFFILTLRKALFRCSPGNRAMNPNLTWLLLIPFFGAIWIFFVVINMAKSLGAEFRDRGIAAEAEPGKTIGLAYAVLGLCWFIPTFGQLAGIGALVCWVIYWIKIAGYSNQLASPSHIVTV